MNSSRIVICQDDLFEMIQNDRLGVRGQKKAITDGAAVIKQLHELNITHRDIKPPNIFFRRGGAGASPRARRHPLRYGICWVGIGGLLGSGGAVHITGRKECGTVDST